MPFHWPFFFSFQNFVQIISNLLAEENRDKWEEAQLVRLPAWGAAGVSAPPHSPGRLLGSNPRWASPRKSLSLLSLGVPIRQMTGPPHGAQGGV